MRSHRLGSTATAAVAVACWMILVSPASWAAPAGTIDVRPGAGTLAAALAGAQPGDVLRLHGGVFTGPVTVLTADVTIEPAGDGAVTIDGGCTSIAAVTIEADGLSLTGPMTVTGGRIYELNAFDIVNGTVNGLTLDPGTCRGSVGMFLQRAGAVLVSRVAMDGFGGAGIEVLGVTDTDGGRLTLASNVVTDSGYGIIAQDIPPGSLAISGNRVLRNQFAGITLQNADGVLIHRNVAKNDGSYGIALDRISDGNRVVRNRAHGNEFDLSNAGSGNCFRANRYVTSQGDIGC